MDLKTGEHTSKKVRLLSEYIMALSITKSTAAQSEMFEHQNATNIDCLSAMCQKYIMSKFANGLTFPLHQIQNNSINSFGNTDTIQQT